MKRIAQFEKVSILQFKEEMLHQMQNFKNNFGKAIVDMLVNNSDGYDDKTKNKVILGIYDDVIQLPTRKTQGSAGYDIVTPFDISLEPYESVVIPTGIKCFIHDGWVLKVYPRSGLGFKFRCRFANTVGIIDADYYGNADNEGHILLNVTNEGNKKMELHAGDRFAQGIFVEFGITRDDDVVSIRNGGIGSTGR